MGTVWVNGATGFVGQELVRGLIDSGHSVIALTHRRRPPRSFPSEGVTLAKGDVLSPDTLVSSMEGCDTAIHLVGIIVEKRKASFYQVHYLGAVNVIEAAREAGVSRFLLMSALGARSEAVSLYHRTKWMAERYLSASDLDYTIMRPSVIFGAEDSFVNMLARMTKVLPVVPVMGTGNGRLQPIWLKDVSACFVRALSTPDSTGKIYELGGPKQYTFVELLETVARLVGRKSRRLHVPLSLARPLAALMETVLPSPPLTRDQLSMLEEPNICDIAPMVNDLGIQPAALEDVFAGYYGNLGGRRSR